MSTESTPTMAAAKDNGQKQHSRDELRAQVANDVEAFLAAGGEVQEVERGKRADPPKAPSNQYGSRPI
ncbi:hypothetical protein [Saccharospirillum mangrovi]|uniref:hypothetical protein n=1 Tax=Saccharospirillum mangrovi TaxID=2161747 RepID=UPI000D34CA57|nr:hypothetical protein [Saccharospirillum mangrovi]